MLPDALKAQNFAEESCTANIDISSNVKLLRGYWGHNWPILRKCYGHLCHNYALRFLIWFKFLLSSIAMTTEENVI